MRLAGFASHSEIGVLSGDALSETGVVVIHCEFTHQIATLAPGKARLRGAGDHGVTHW
jgi:hypothetical protein